MTLFQFHAQLRFLVTLNVVLLCKTNRLGTVSTVSGKPLKGTLCASKAIRHCSAKIGTIAHKTKEQLQLPDTVLIFIPADFNAVCFLNDGAFSNLSSCNHTCREQLCSRFYKWCYQLMMEIIFTIACCNNKLPHLDALILSNPHFIVQLFSESFQNLKRDKLSTSVNFWDETYV